MKFRAQELLKLKLKNVPAYISEKVIELRRQIRCSAWRITAKNRSRLEDDVRESAGRILYLAVDSYRPAPYSGRLIYFKAAERPPGNEWDNSRGWLHLVNGELDVYEVPGDHLSMFLEPNVASPAEILGSCLNCETPSRFGAATAGT